VGLKPRAESSYEFLFLGAGDATYFEWGEVHVWFAREPTKSEAKKIRALVPPPLRDSIEFKKRHLMAASDQFVNVWVAQTYGRGVPASFSGRFFFALDEDIDRFNAAIEEWLRSIHQIVPVVAAFRAEDEESGGTQLSDWHTWSMKEAKRLRKSGGLPPELAGWLKL